MPLRKFAWTAWREAAWIFLLSRLTILLLTAIAVFRIPLGGQTSARNCAVENCLLSSWYHWDVIAYVQVASQGYSNLRDTVFFPLWPLLMQTGALFGATPIYFYIAGMLLANVFFFLALVLLYLLLSEDFDVIVARNALFYLAFSPYALFFFAGYAESLFLLLCLAVFLFLRRERYWLVGLSGFLAALTRSQGVLLIVPFAVVVVQRLWGKQWTWGNWVRKLKISFPLVLIPFGVVVYMLYLAFTKGDALAFSTQEALSWNRHLTFPLVSILQAFQTFFLAESQDLHFLNVVDLTFTFLALAILVVGWKRLPLHYSLFALAALFFDLSYPQGMQVPLTAVGRYILVIFPLFAVLALWGKQPRIDRFIIACSLPLFALNTVLFIEHYWVA